jgi:hypothetical protein
MTLASCAMEIVDAKLFVKVHRNRIADRSLLALREARDPVLKEFSVTIP